MRRLLVMAAVAMLVLSVQLVGAATPVAPRHIEAFVALGDRRQTFEIARMQARGAPSYADPVLHVDPDLRRHPDLLTLGRRGCIAPPAPHRALRTLWRMGRAPGVRGPRNSARHTGASRSDIGPTMRAQPRTPRDRRSLFRMPGR
jgi:hypothetical protein